MSFRTAYGNAYSENGWRMCNRDECDDAPPPRLPGLRLPVRSGVASAILKGWVTWFSENVENLNNPGRGFTDEGCFTSVNDVKNSNHLSGTAIDANWSEHDFRVSYSGFTPGEIARVRQGLELFEDTIWWGQDWSAPKDPMHFQLNLSESNPKNAQFAAKLLSGYLGLYAANASAPPPIVVIPVGNASAILEYGSTGPAVVALQQGMNKVFPRYRACPLATDGDYGPLTESAVIEFQQRSGLDVDGIVGPITRAELGKYGIRP
jgi:hypothetical protein